MNILTLIVFLPTIGGLLCLVVPRQHIRTVAVAFALGTFDLNVIFVESDGAIAAALATNAVADSAYLLKS